MPDPLTLNQSKPEPSAAANHPAQSQAPSGFALDPDMKIKKNYVRGKTAE